MTSRVAPPGAPAGAQLGQVVAGGWATASPLPRASKSNPLPRLPADGRRGMAGGRSSSAVSTTRAAVGGARRSNPGPSQQRPPLSPKEGATGSAPSLRALAEGRPLGPPGGPNRPCRPTAGRPLRDDRPTRAAARLTALHIRAGAPARRGCAAPSRPHVRAGGCPRGGAQRRLASTAAQAQRVFTRAPRRPFDGGTCWPSSAAHAPRLHREPTRPHPRTYARGYDGDAHCLGVPTPTSLAFLSLLEHSRLCDCLGRRVTVPAAIPPPPVPIAPRLPETCPSAVRTTPPCVG